MSKFQIKQDRFDLSTFQNLFDKLLPDGEIFYVSTIGSYAYFHFMSPIESSPRRRKIHAIPPNSEFIMPPNWKYLGASVGFGADRYFFEEV